MIPLMMSFVAERKEEKPGVLRAFLFSLVFILGLAVTFTVLGMIAALAGKMVDDFSATWNWIVAAVCAVMGLHLMGVLTIPIPSLGGKLQPKKRREGSSARSPGAVVRRGVGPCAAPILIVLFLAGSGSSVPWGGTLLLIYALGHSVLILIAGTSMGATRQLIERKKATRVLDLLCQGAGAAIVLVGVYFA